MYRRIRFAIRWSILFCIVMAAGRDACQAQPIDVTLVNNLNFGNVFAGIPKVIPKNTAGAAAEFHVSGTAGAEVLLTFLNLPRYINMSGYSMNVIFNDNDCAMDSSASPNQSSPGYDNQNPWQQITYRLGANGLTVWLGATIVPNIGQKPGSYSGLIQLKAEYTGQ